MPAFLAATDQVKSVFGGRSGNLTFPPAAARDQVTDAVALRLGTLVDRKRIVITVGEKAVKMPMTYGKGASADWLRQQQSLQRICMVCQFPRRMGFTAAPLGRWRLPAR